MPALVRFGGTSFERLNDLRSDCLLGLAAELSQCCATVKSLEQETANILAAIVPTLPTVELRGAVLALKRALFNGKLVSDKLLRSVLVGLECNDAVRVHEVLRLRAECDRRRDHFGVEYKCALLATRRAFQQLSGDHDFASGLLLSSPVLFSELRRYRHVVIDQMRAKDTQIERGLLRYFSRMASKATPFGMFCGVNVGEVVQDADERLGSEIMWIEGDPYTKRSFVRLNKTLLAMIWPALLEQREIRSSTLVRVNPTLVEVGDQVRFLALFEAREVFQRVKSGDVVRLATTLAGRLPRYSHSALIERMAEDQSVDASHSEAELFVDRLIELGVLQLECPVTDQDSRWERRLAAVLRESNNELATTAAGHLETLAEDLDAYGMADIATRVELSRSMRACTGALCGALQIPPPADWNLVFYEDAGCSGVLKIRESALKASSSELERHAAVLARVAWVREQQCMMRRFFDSHYTVDVTQISLLSFYEDYYRGYYKDRIDRMRGRPTNPRPPLPTHAEESAIDGGSALAAHSFVEGGVRTFGAARARLTEIIAEFWAESPTAEEVKIPLARLEDAVRDVPPLNDAVSYSVFCQLATSPGQVRLVVPSGSVLPGHGKFYSRFLYVLGQEVEERLREDNANWPEDLVEVACDGAFNANLHPCLVGASMPYPTDTTMPQDVTQLSVTNLDVARAPDGTSLWLISRSTGTRVVPVDLGFLTPALRPPLFQLLTHFCPGFPCVLALPEHPAPDQPIRDPEQEPVRPVVRYRPRVVLGEQLVVARRRWQAVSQDVPTIRSGELSDEFFLRLNEWRSAAGIPERVYLRILPSGQPSAAPALADAAATAKLEPIQPATGGLETLPSSADERADQADVIQQTKPTALDNIAAAARPSRDYHKPQFLDFASPLLISLFARTLGNAPPSMVVFEECLPSSETLPLSESGRYATEIVLQGRLVPNHVYSDDLA